MDSSGTASEALDDRARGVLKIVFLTLFLDLVGFSIIFPLYPAMLDYYLLREGDAGMLGGLVRALTDLTESVGGPSDIGVIVLFGGLLASLYSLLQFAFTPLFGSLSDRYGRRPILLFCLTGLLVSYAMWFVAGSFALLLLARTLGGIMSANISTATAIVADVTSVRNRSKGMAIIGMAFGLGFIVGPVIGGVSAEIDLTARWDGAAALGINPFSVPAFVAFVLTAFNLGWVARRLPETRPESAPTERVKRTVNPLILFRTDEYPGVTKTNWTNFVFLVAFSGTEFGLTFLAAERFGYGPRQNAYLFLFIGVVLVLMQGGYVRRRAPIIGPKRMAIHGFLAITPGFLLVGFAESVGVLYAGLFLMAVGAAQIIPCLTALASSYTPEYEQGRVLGVFRSLGALARGIGPLLACLLYWRLGGPMSYALLAALLLLPFALTTALPPIKDGETTEL